MKYLAAFALATAVSPLAFAQSQHETHFCGSDIYFEQQAQLHPELLTQRDQEVSDFIENPNSFNYSPEGTIHTIPVVVHVMYYNFTDSISIEQVQDGIAVLNEDWSLSNSDAGNVRAQFASLQANMEFEFKLAKIDPNGKATTGVTYHQSDRSLGATDAIKAEYNWPNDKYLNVWAVRAIDLGLDPSQGTILGYAAFPTTNQAVTSDGVVIRHDQLGRIGTASSSMGRTLTHEVGHWLNLLHPFNYGCNNGGDLVGDTPPVSGPSYGCDLTKTSCGQTTMIENFMDYADDVCTNLFTEGQKSRAKTAVTTTVWNRDDVASASNLLATGVSATVVNAPPTAQFTMDRQMVFMNDTVGFTNMSTSYLSGTTYNWTFTSGNNTFSSTLENPEMTFSAPGTYTATLTVTNSAGSDVHTKTRYFRVVDPYVTVYDNSFTATFENQLPNPTWMVIDDGDGRKWQTTNLAAFGGSKSAQMPTKSTLADGIDILQSSPILLDETATATLSFRYAWSRQETSNQDRMTVTVSTDGGKTWQIARIFSSFTLNTTGGTLTTSTFVPTTAQWAEATVSLNNFIGPDPIMIRFNYTSNGGNNLYIDEVRTAVTVGMEENANGITRIYPNPATDMIHVEYTGDYAQWNMTSLEGRMISQGELNNGNGTIDVSSLPAGLYMIQLTNNGRTTTERVVIQ